MSESHHLQLRLFADSSGPYPSRRPPRQLLKWIGNKQRFAPEITRYVPLDYHRYIEPFVGAGAMLGALAPHAGLAGDVLKPLIEIWRLVQDEPDRLIASYAARRERFLQSRREVYLSIREAYNKSPNPFDLLFISRSCYGGVVRFTKEGTISTPIGPHTPISAQSFRKRVYAWRKRIRHTRFVCADFEETMAEAGTGDVVYCDPPYVYSQSILYGAQEFTLDRLWRAINRCASAGARVMLSIDGKKKSGRRALDIEAPPGLFKREILVDCGRSMLRRFQREGETLEDEVVHDRLMLTW